MYMNADISLAEMMVKSDLVVNEGKGILDTCFLIKTCVYMHTCIHIYDKTYIHIHKQIYHFNNRAPAPILVTGIKMFSFYKVGTIRYELYKPS
jgi:hypothetical protein